MTRTVFFGTPAIAVPSLVALYETTELVSVVCQPDRPAGRGMKLSPPAVKLKAVELGVEVHQPLKVRTGNLDAWLREREVEVAIVLAYGRILPEAVLSAPSRGCLNLHASLLPAYRGAAPINWAIMRGETVTGVSLMQMDAGLDTGPVFTLRELAIAPRETAGELAARVAELAATMVREDLPRVLSGELTAVAQDSSLATYAPPLEKPDLGVDWTRSAREVSGWIRGLSPLPAARSHLGGKAVKLLAASESEARCPSGAPGEVVIADKTGLVVACGSGHVELYQAQFEGRKALARAELINGRLIQRGDVFGPPP